MKLLYEKCIYQQLSKKEIAYSPVSVEDEVVTFIFKLEVENNQAAGEYTGDIVYIVVPTF